MRAKFFHLDLDKNWLMYRTCLPVPAAPLQCHRLQTVAAIGVLVGVPLVFFVVVGGDGGGCGGCGGGSVLLLLLQL